MDKCTYTVFCERFEVLTAVKMTMLFFWVFSPEDGDSMFLQNIAIYL
jgi:hypothetical protein